MELISSVEHIDYLTTSVVHVTKSEPRCDIECHNRYLIGWNVGEEKWQNIPLVQIVIFERLTGEGIKDMSENNPTPPLTNHQQSGILHL